MTDDELIAALKRWVTYINYESVYAGVRPVLQQAADRLAELQYDIDEPNAGRSVSVPTREELPHV